MIGNWFIHLNICFVKFDFFEFFFLFDVRTHILLKQCVGFAFYDFQVNFYRLAMYAEIKI